MSSLSEIHVPTEDVLLEKLHQLALSEEPIARCLAAIESGLFVHPDGRTDDLQTVRISPQQAALLSHFALECPTPLSVEIGFGMGSSAAVILSSRSAAGKPFEHVIFDPYGLGDGRGYVVRSYLQDYFGDRFRLVEKRSEQGLSDLREERGAESAGLVFIDGGHRFENVMTDFVLADALCCVGGLIIFDDAWFPAIETVINYVRSNRPDYAIAHLPVLNCSVLKKIGADHRTWCSFKPFLVPNRVDWSVAEVVKPWWRRLMRPTV